MRQAVIIDGARSPFVKARPDGAFSGLHPVDLHAQVLAGLIERTGVDPGSVEDVITGCVLQVAEQSANIARQATLAAGFPEHVPGVTLDRKCGSAQQAIDFAAWGVIAGAYDAAIAGGVEMMSVVPMRSNRMGKDNLGTAFRNRYPTGLVHQGISAELIAARWSVSRAEQDAYALRSHHRAVQAQAAGHLDKQIVPIRLGDHGATTITRDDGLRADTSEAKLASLRPAFEDPATKERFAQINWSVTAGNASQVTDGSTALLVMEENHARRLGLRPRARIKSFAVVGDDPYLMLTGIIPATHKLLDRARLAIGDIDVFEVNEAFASVVIAWMREFHPLPEKVNPMGGAIAYGHPVGASGGRLMLNLLDHLERTGGRYGLQVMCESGGMANATLIERCD